MHAIVCERLIEEDFVLEAIRRAESAGFFPARAQRAVDWEAVRAWAIRVRQPGFRWCRPDTHLFDAIIVGPGINGRIAVHAGQHRILGGLLGGNPVPRECMTFLTIFDRARGWLEEPAIIDVLDLLGG